MDTETAPFFFECLEGKTGLDTDTFTRLDSPGHNRQRLPSYLETTSVGKQVSHWRLPEVRHKAQHDIKIEHMVTGSKQILLEGLWKHRLFKTCQNLSGAKARTMTKVRSMSLRL